MKNNLLVQVLEKFNKKELNRLSNYLNSPFFNTSKNLVTTFEYLTKCLKNKQEASKIDLFQHLFNKKEPYQDQKVRLILSDLLKLIESFIIYQLQEKKSNVQQVNLAKYYLNQGLEKHFNRVQRRVNHQLDQQLFRNHEYYAAKDLIEWEQYELISSKQRDLDVNLEDMGENLDIAYFSNKLRQACFLKAQQAFYTVEYDFKWVEQMLQYLEQKGWQAIPAISLYYTAYQLSAVPEKTDSFNNLKDQILKYGALFPSSEIRQIYILAINFCIKKVNNGERNYANESMKLYKKGLEVGCFLENGFLSKFTYANIIAFGLMTKDFDWTITFITDYKSKLKKTSRESAFAFNMARLVYVKDKDYENALNYLQKVSDKDLLNTLNAKILQLRIYYEIDAFELLESHLEAMSNFIRRKEVIGYHKENFLNIIKYTKRLLKVNLYDKKEIEKLKQAIKTEGIISEKAWLLEQID